MIAAARRWAVVVAMSVIAALLLILTASAGAAQSNTDTTDTTESSTTTTALDQSLGFAIVNSGEECGVVAADAAEAGPINANQAICVSAADGLDFTESKLRQTDNRLDFDFEWEPNELASDFTVELSRNGGTPVRLKVEADLALSVRWRTDGPDGPLQTEPGDITEAGVYKVITVSGSDLARLTGDLVVHEVVPADNLVPRELSSDTAVNDGRFDIAVGGDEVQYRVALAPQANSGETDATLTSELRYQGVAVLPAVETQVEVKAPQLDVEFSNATSSIIDAATARVEISLENLGVPLTEALTVTLSIVEESDALSGFEQISDGGAPDEKTVSWSIPRDQLTDDKLTRSVQARITRSSQQANLNWRVTVARSSNPDVALDIATKLVEVTAASAPSSDDDTVEFSPGQLIRLIAFVIAFALLAIIFGAWMRTRNSPPAGSGEAAEAERNHELNIFKSFAESITVLVILVSILVLALQGSLEAESAGSLIGVIAGYVLGQGRK